MDTSIIDFNERLKSITLVDMVVGFIAAFIVSIVFDAILKVFGVKNAEFTILLALLLFFVFCLRGVTGFKSSLDQVFAQENRNDILYLFIFNFLFGFFVLSLFGSLDPTFAKGLGVSNSSGLGLVLVAINSIILAPIIEELLFRGVIFSRLNMRMNFVYAMIISSVLFSLFHGFGRLIVTFVFGLAMCLVYLKTNNILIPICIHILSNLLGTIFTDFLHIEKMAATAPLSYILLLVSVISGIMMIRYIRRNTQALKSY